MVAALILAFGPKTLPFQLRSPAFIDGGVLPIEFTGDGEGISPPLAWTAGPPGPPGPPGTKGYALIMSHVDREGRTKWYWIVWNIPATTKALPNGNQSIGITGTNSINPNLAYAPPHSRGPGTRTYVLTLYALSAPPRLSFPPDQVSRDVLLRAMRGLILARTELRTTHTTP
jgi:phosphatidylethanolamine-binding protein (PEBP) family uncharacterized protein